MIMSCLREKHFFGFCFLEHFQLKNHFDVETSSWESQHFIKSLSFRETKWGAILCIKKAFYFKPFSYSPSYCQQDVILTHTMLSFLPDYWYVWLRECKHTDLFYSLERKTEESLKASCFQDWLCVYVKRRKLSISVVRTREATSLTFHLSF